MHLLDASHEDVHGIVENRFRAEVNLPGRGNISDELRGHELYELLGQLIDAISGVQQGFGRAVLGEVMDCSIRSIEVINVNTFERFETTLDVGREHRNAADELEPR